ncbi:breast carcinoma-amplified sequence 1 [Ctenodactylus gundi]
MGNQMSIPQRVEDQENEQEADTYKAPSDSEHTLNGTPVIISTCTVQHYDEVDLGISVQKDGVATSSPQTTDAAGGKGLGREAKAQAPAAKSRFFLTLSRPVPGRTGDQGADSSPAAAALEVSSDTALANKGASERPAQPAAAAPGPAADKTPGPGPAGEQAAGAAPAKPRDASFLDKLFKLDKGREKAAADRPQAAQEAQGPEEAEEVLELSPQPPGVAAREEVELRDSRATRPPAAQEVDTVPVLGERPGAGGDADSRPDDSGLLRWEVVRETMKPSSDGSNTEENLSKADPASNRQTDTRTRRTRQRLSNTGYQPRDTREEVISGYRKPSDIGDGRETEEGDLEAFNCAVPGDPEGQEVAKEDSQLTDTTESSSSIMSFFKTLVSPNKAETKKDPEDTVTKADSVCDGHAGPKVTETQAKGSKKKHLGSPRVGLAVRKFFKHKGTENSPSTSANIKSDKVTVSPQGTPGTAKSPKGCSSPAQPSSATATEATREGAKEKPGPTSLPLGKLFWKKSVKEDSVPTGAQENVVCESPVETVQLEEADTTLQTAGDSEERDGASTATDVKLKKEEGKPRKTSLMAFFRQVSVKGDGGITHSEEINGKDSNNQTSSSTQKATTPPEPEPTGAAQKGKEGSAKDKKSAAEVHKQKNSTQEAKDPASCADQAAVEVNSLQNGDKSQKRPEKRRQSLGGFLKGLGPKRMSDAQVQTDPVSIGPAGKSKCTGKRIFSHAKKTWPFPARR